MEGFLLSGLFWLLALLVLQPFRAHWSLVAFLVLTNVNMSGAWFEASESVGWANALHSLALPAWLLLLGMVRLAKSGRSPLDGIRLLLPSGAFWLWCALVAYGALASIWSPLPFSALKMNGALLSHTLVFLAFYHHALAGWLHTRVAWWAVAAMVALALVQTYLLGGAWDAHSAVLAHRLTSFSSPQSFAQGLVALGALLLWSPGARSWPRLAGVLALFALLALNGSRLSFLGAVAAVLVWLLRRMDRQRLTVLVGLTAVTGLVLVSPPGRELLSTSRLGEMAAMVSPGAAGTGEIATFRWRRQVYSCVANELATRERRPLLRGSGTSSAGLLDGVCTGMYMTNVNPNRLLHNEFLRIGYEWGLVGLAAALYLIWILLRTGWRRWREPVREWATAPGGALASAIPLLLLSLAFENVLQAAGGPGPVAFALVVAWAAADADRGRRTAPPWETEAPGTR